MLTREEIENLEEERLAPYAMKSKRTRGRSHKEEEHPYRTVYQRDRDRIVHSTAFRRLEYKTQVFVNHEGDYYRTRLTHTLEVSQIGRSIARTLKLNEDLVEAIALVHDVGHTPFGHSGEEALNLLMKEHGGFDHNLHGLRVVQYLEQRYPEFNGLNLSWEVREGITKHRSYYDMPAVEKEFEPQMSPTLEAQVVNIADEIAYDNHDLDDGITSSMISEAELRKVALWKEVSKDVQERYAGISSEIRKYQIIKRLIDIQITDLIRTTQKNLEENNIFSLDDVRNAGKELVSLSKDLNPKRLELRDFLKRYLYSNYRVIRMANKAHRFIVSLFKAYLESPEQLPPTSKSRLKEEGEYRVVCDYIAGMTDRYALDDYRKLFEPYERV